MRKKVFEGKLFVYSEQGMEGGIMLCLQDKNYIELVDIHPPIGVYTGRKVWDKKNKKRTGTITHSEAFIDKQWKSYIDPLLEDEDYTISSLYCGENKGDMETDKRLSAKYHFKIKYTAERLDELYGKGNWEKHEQVPYITLQDGKNMYFGDVPITIPQRPYLIPENTKTRVSIKRDDGTIEEKRPTKGLSVEEWDSQGLHLLKASDFLKIFDPNTKKLLYEGQIKNISSKPGTHTFPGYFSKTKKKKSPEWEIYFKKKYNAELYRDE